MNKVITIGNVRGFVDSDGTAKLNAEDVARGWGFVEEKDGKEYIRWRTVNGYLKGFGFSQDVAKDDYLPENMVYRLGFKASNEAAQKFQAFLADEVLPTLRKTGAYTAQVSPNPHYRTRMIGTAVRDIGKTAEEIAKVFKVKTGMAMASAMAMVGDAYGIDTNPLRPLLPAEENPGYMNATAIAGKLGILNGKGKPDPKQVNLILESKGFQRKEGNDWRLNDAGTEYGEEKPYKHGNHSGYQVVWNDKVLYAFK